jgi:E3 ubiquitin-protein ligase MYCBP2
MFVMGLTDIKYRIKDSDIHYFFGNFKNYKQLNLNLLSLPQIAITCWGIKFRPSDHQFLHRSHVFSTISRILSRSEELDNAAANTTLNNASSLCESEGSVEKFVDVTANLELKVSSRQAMIGSLNDNSTETFWESGDEDRNKAKWLTATLLPQFRPQGKF